MCFVIVKVQSGLSCVFGCVHGSCDVHAYQWMGWHLRLGGDTQTLSIILCTRVRDLTGLDETDKCARGLPVEYKKHSPPVGQSQRQRRVNGKPSAVLSEIAETQRVARAGS